MVAKIQWHQDEFFPRVGFIVTNLGGGAKAVVNFYNQRCAAEQWIKEGQTRRPLDPPVVFQLRRQSGTAATSRLGVQPGQLPPALGTARER